MHLDSDTPAISVILFLTKSKSTALFNKGKQSFNDVKDCPSLCKTYAENFGDVRNYTSSKIPHVGSPASQMQRGIRAKHGPLVVAFDRGENVYCDRIRGDRNAPAANCQLVIRPKIGKCIKYFGRGTARRV